MPRLALPATSATHTLSHPLLSFSATLSRVLPTYPPRTHVHGNPPISWIVSSLVSIPLTLFLSRTETTVRRLLSFTPSFLYSLSLFLFPILYSRFSPHCPLYLSLSLALFLSLSYVSISISPSFSFPLSRLSIPRATILASSSPLIPLTLSREGTLADAPDVSTVRLSLPVPAATDANGVVTTTDVALPSLSSATLLESDLRFSSPFPSSGNANEGGVVVVLVVVPSFAFKLD